VLSRARPASKALPPAKRKLAAFNQVDGIAIEAILAQQPRGGSERAVLQRHHDHAVIPESATYSSLLKRTVPPGKAKVCAEDLGLPPWAKGPECHRGLT